MSPDLPPEVGRLLEDRATARAERDWEAADRLRDRIRELGWEPIDGPGGSTARPALPAAASADPAYARAEDLASRIGDEASLAASVVVVVEGHREDAERLAAGLRAHQPPQPWELIVVANAPEGELDAEAVATGLPAEVVGTTARLGWADAANLGLRRARGGVAVLLDPSVEPRGDFVTPLLAALDDESTGIAGPWGVVSDDGRHFHDAPPGEVDAVLAYCLAIRRAALRRVRGFDPRFRFYRNADLDFSFAVRDAGWRAVATDALPLVRHEHRGWTAFAEAERERLSRRNFYRFLDRWRDRPDLLLARSAASAQDESHP